MKLITRIFGTILIFLLIIMFILLILGMPFDQETIYETENIADYGKVIGNYDNETPAKFISQFFPEKILNSFSDVTYHYTAKKGDTYAYECYLEFVIEDEAEFRAFLVQYEDQYEPAIFNWDSSFMECNISNVFDTDWTSASAEKGYPIQYAKIGKILYSPDEQRVIFWALGVWDGGGVGTAQLHYFFDRFQIDVLDYQMEAYVFEKDQEAGITYQDRYELDMPTFYPYPEGN